jgi:hypothetical protein
MSAAQPRSWNRWIPPSFDSNQASTARGRPNSGKIPAKTPTRPVKIANATRLERDTRGAPACASISASFSIALRTSVGRGSARVIGRMADLCLCLAAELFGPRDLPDG